MSITTVGFGDIVPKSHRDKLFTCVYLLFGVWVLGYAPYLTSTLPPNLPLTPTLTLALTLALAVALTPTLTPTLAP